MPVPVLAIAAGISALFKYGKGLKQERDGKALAEGNKRPDYSIQQEYFDNQSIAESQAGQGFTSRTVENYNTQNERGLQSTIDAVLQTGGGAGAIQGALGQYQLGNRSFAAADSEKQTANITALYDRNLDLASQKVQEWAIDKYKPFLDTAASATAQKAAGELNKDTALSEGLAAGGTIASSLVNAGLLKKSKGKDNSGNAGEETEGDGAKYGDGSSTDKFNINSMGESFRPNNNAGGMESDYVRWLQEEEEKRKRLEAQGDGELSPEQIRAIGQIVNRRKTQ
jgi:hypothetical protein